MFRHGKINPDHERILSQVLKEVGSQLPVADALGHLAAGGKLGGEANIGNEATPNDLSSANNSIDLLIPEQRTPAGDPVAAKKQ